MQIKNLWLFALIAIVGYQLISGKTGFYFYMSAMFCTLFFYLSWICELLKPNH